MIVAALSQAVGCCCVWAAAAAAFCAATTAGKCAAESVTAAINFSSIERTLLDTGNDTHCHTVHLDISLVAII
jgi:hypothetical protein